MHPADTAAHVEWAEFGAAWDRLLGQPADRLTLRRLLESGWAAADVADVAGLADQACEERTALAVAAREIPRFVAHDLFQAAEVLAEHLHLGPAAALPWLRLVAGSPDKDGLTWVRVLTWTNAKTGRPLLDVHPPAAQRYGLLAAWVRALPETIAALAYAAGLTLAEAKAGHRAGTLSEDGLRTLAGMRGYRMTVLAP